MGATRDPENDQQLPANTVRSRNVFDEMTGGIPMGDPLERELIEMIASRERYGVRKYGQPLMTHTGRSAAKDALEEAFDLWAYLTQAQMEARDDGRTADSILYRQLALDARATVRTLLREV